jgi:hypothetical protein
MATLERMPSVFVCLGLMLDIVSTPRSKENFIFVVFYVESKRERFFGLAAFAIKSNALEFLVK